VSASAGLPRTQRRAATRPGSAAHTLTGGRERLERVGAARRVGQVAGRHAAHQARAAAVCNGSARAAERARGAWPALQSMRARRAPVSSALSSRKSPAASRTREKAMQNACTSRYSSCAHLYG